MFATVTNLFSGNKSKLVKLKDRSLPSNFLEIRYGDSSEQVYKDAFLIATEEAVDKVEGNLYSKTVVGIKNGKIVSSIKEELFQKSLALLNNSAYETVPGIAIRRMVINRENPEFNLHCTSYNEAYWQQSSHLFPKPGIRRDLRWLYVEDGLNIKPFCLRHNNTKNISLLHLKKFLISNTVEL